MTVSDLRARLALLAQQPIPPVAWIVLLWAVLTIPAIGLRGVHYEEGTTIALARGAFEDGYWLQPHMYGMRFVERPVLISMLLGHVGALTGWLPLWVARIPSVLAHLAGALLVYSLVARSVGWRGALFGAACLLLSPMMAQKHITAEVDVVVSAMLFAAFVLWWRAVEQGAPTPARWVVITAILVAASLVKGPQQLAYFFLGVGAFLAWRRSWRQLAALVLCGLAVAGVTFAWYAAVYRGGDDATVWYAHARLDRRPGLGRYIYDFGRFAVSLALEWLPAILLAAPLAWAAARRRVEQNRDLILALTFFVVVTTVVVLIWPSARTRYAMPGTLAVAALAGLAFDHVRMARPRLASVATASGALVLAYLMLVNWLVLPLAPWLSRAESAQGEFIAEAIRHRPAPLLVSPNAPLSNVAVHIPPPIRIMPLEEIRRQAPPFWAFVLPAEADILRATGNGAATSYLAPQRPNPFVFLRVDAAAPMR